MDLGNGNQYLMVYGGVINQTYTKEKVPSKDTHPSPPGDPTLAKIGNTWNMYYGYHTKGIYRAVLHK